MRVAVDANRLIDLLRGDTRLAERLGVCDEVSVPLIVLGEIQAGFHGGTERHRNEALLQRFLAEATVRSTTPGSLCN